MAVSTTGLRRFGLADHFGCFCGGMGQVSDLIATVKAGLNLVCKAQQD